MNAVRFIYRHFTRFWRKKICQNFKLSLNTFILGLKIQLLSLRMVFNKFSFQLLLSFLYLSLFIYYPKNHSRNTNLNKPYLNKP